MMFLIMIEAESNNTVVILKNISNPSFNTIHENKYARSKKIVPTMEEVTTEENKTNQCCRLAIKISSSGNVSKDFLFLMFISKRKDFIVVL